MGAIRFIDEMVAILLSPRPLVNELNNQKQHSAIFCFKLLVEELFAESLSLTNTVFTFIHISRLQITPPIVYQDKINIDFLSEKIKEMLNTSFCASTLILRLISQWLNSVIKVCVLYKCVMYL